MIPSLLRFDAAGTIRCLYTEVVDLRTLGVLEVSRATEIRFHSEIQEWCVHRIGDDAVLHSDPSRKACLRWELEHLA